MKILLKILNAILGIFRPTKPKTKLLQNLLTSHEIKFGDAFERLIDSNVFVTNMLCDLHVNGSGSYAFLLYRLGSK
nr:hypothetical protein [Helicobacter pylori]